MFDFIGYILHFDKYLSNVAASNSSIVYIILLVMIFCETGLVITPFLPGDSMIFTAGALAALGSLDIKLLFVIICVAAIAGDSANYAIGRSIGNNIYEKSTFKFIKKEYLDETRVFYEKHGNTTIVLARFIPVIRTFAPFIAGIGEMEYGRFIIYNIAGAIAWVSLFLFGGFFFGNLQFVKEHFMVIVIAIVIISIVPGLVAIIKQKLKNKE